jgi:hypothetical protein
VNLLLLAAVLGVIYTGGWEYSVRRYLDGFSDAIVPDSMSSEQQVEAILQWIRSGSLRADTSETATLSMRDPETTLNYRELLRVCGTATNAFLNLARSKDLKARRLLLLGANGTATHVVAEVLIDGRWVIADPVYHVLLRDAHGALLTRTQLRDPAVFLQATTGIPGYKEEYNYNRFTHVRIQKLPLDGFHLPWLLNRVFPTWEDAIDWSILLERESFLALTIAVIALLSFLVARLLLGWYADRRLGIPRFRLRSRIARAGATFFHAPEIK